MRELALWAAGDPLDKTTWSGTPAALAAAFAEAGIVIEPGNGESATQLSRWFYAPAIVRGRGASRFRSYWGYLQRRNVARWKGFRELHPTMPSLHTDYMWLSPDSVGPNDYLYRDSGWDSWARNRGLRGRLAAQIGERLRGVLDRAGGVFATSEWSRQELIAAGAHPSRTHVVYTGVGNLISPYRGPKDYGSQSVLCVAKVRHRDKGVDLLLDAFAQLGAMGHGATLDFVGGGFRGPVPSNVRLHGSVSGAQLIDMFRNAALFAMPARYEPHGLVYLEALLSRTPILGSNLAALPEFAGIGSAQPRGFVADPLDSPTIAERIRSALADADRLATMGWAGLDYAEHMTWSRVVHDMTAIMFGGHQGTGE